MYQNLQLGYFKVKVIRPSIFVILKELPAEPQFGYFQIYKFPYWNFQQKL